MVKPETKVVVERAPRAIFMLDVWSSGDDPPLLETDEPTGRLVVVVTNQGGYDSTSIDLKELIGWLRKHMPEVLD